MERFLSTEPLIKSPSEPGTNLTALTIPSCPPRMSKTPRALPSWIPISLSHCEEWGGNREKLPTPVFMNRNVSWLIIRRRRSLPVVARELYFYPHQMPTDRIHPSLQPMDVYYHRSLGTRWWFEASSTRPPRHKHGPKERLDVVVVPIIR